MRSRLRDSSPHPGGPVPTRSTCSVARHPTVCKEAPQFLASLPAEPGGSLSVQGTSPVEGSPRTIHHRPAQLGCHFFQPALAVYEDQYGRKLVSF